MSKEISTLKNEKKKVEVEWAQKLIKQGAEMTKKMEKLEAEVGRLRHENKINQ